MKIRVLLSWPFCTMFINCEVHQSYTSGERMVNNSVAKTGRCDLCHLIHLTLILMVGLMADVNAAELPLRVVDGKPSCQTWRFLRLLFWPTWNHVEKKQAGSYLSLQFFRSETSFFWYMSVWVHSLNNCIQTDMGAPKPWGIPFFPRDFCGLENPPNVGDKPIMTHPGGTARNKEFFCKSKLSNCFSYDLKPHVVYVYTYVYIHIYI